MDLSHLDKKLSIELLHPYLLIENELRSQRALYEELEPKKKGYTARKKAAFAASIPNWLHLVGVVRTWVQGHEGFGVPELFVL